MRVQIIKDRLNQKFNPRALEVIDDSADHVGHAGSKDGAGHFTVRISNENFRQLSRIEIHKEIYSALADLIPHEIHALQIKLIK